MDYTVYQTYVLFLLEIVVRICAQDISVYHTNDSRTGIDDIFELVEDSESLLNFGNHKDIILVLGNAEADTSTFTHFLAGNTSRMRSVAVRVGSEYNIIIDNKVENRVIPEQVVDTEANIAYYVCPGFGDIRNATFDIATNYFLKKTVDSAISVKLIFVVRHSSVRIRRDRTDFIKLLKHATEFVKDFGKYEKSIALVVTKVDNNYANKDNKFTLVSDDVVASKVATYIIGVKQSAEFKQLKDTEKDFHEKAIKLIKIFLLKINNRYINIVLFRKPDKPGLITNVSLLQNGKKAAQNLFNNVLTFTERSRNDFKFTISAKSKNEVLKLYKMMNEIVIEDITSATIDITNYYTDIIKNSRDLFVLKERLYEEYNVLIETVRELQKSASFKSFFIRFTKFLNALDVSCATDIFAIMLNRYKFTCFLESAADEKFKINTLEWIEPFKNIIIFVKESTNWHLFLTTFYDKLSTYEIFTDIQERKAQFYNSLLTKQGVSQTDYQNLLSILTKHNVNEYKNVRNASMDFLRLRGLNNVLSTVFMNNIIYTFETDKLLIRGDVIRFSDIIHRIPKDLSLVKIFALKAVFIDEDFIRIGSKMVVVIFSPTWQVVGVRRITVDGLPGTNHSQTKASTGLDGKPGNPGGPAGSFIGIGKAFTNNEYLTISANGGIGSPGQDGSDGQPGADAVNSYPTGNLTNGKSIMSANGGYKYLGYSGRTAADNFGDVIAMPIGAYDRVEVHSYLMMGKRGATGGPGRRGGAGGNGGAAGTINLFTFDNCLKVDMFNYKGADGLPGESGVGGVGGMNAQNIQFDFQVTTKRWLGIETGRKTHGWKMIPNGVFENMSTVRGVSGYVLPGLSTNRAISPEHHVMLENTSQIITEYLAFILENSDDSVKRKDLIDFILYLLNITDIKSLFDSTNLLNLILTIKNAYKVPNNINFMPIHKLLLQIILERAQNLKSNGARNYVRPLSYLYTATLSNIISINSKTTNKLIVDIENYTHDIVNNINKIPKQANAVAVKELNFHFNANINTMIFQMDKFIDSKILKEIREQITIVDQKMVEILQIRPKMKNDGDIEKLLRLSITRTMLTNMDTFGKILHFMGTYRLVINKATVSNNKVSDYLTSDTKKQIKYTVLGDIRIILQMFDTALRNDGDDDVMALVHYLDTIKNEISNFPETLRSLSPSVSLLKSELGNKTQYSPTVLKTTQELFLELKNISSKFKGNALENTVNMLRLTGRLVEFMPGVYHRHINYTSKLCYVTELLPNTDLYLLKEYRLIVQNNLLPLVHKVFGSVRSDRTNHLDSWKLYDAMKQPADLLKLLCKRYDNDLVLDIMDKLLETMYSLKNIHELNDEYNVYKEFSDYFTYVNSFVGNENTYKRTSVVLNELIKSNMISAQYNKALDGFKAYMFPYASLYFNEYSLTVDETNKSTSTINNIHTYESEMVGLLKNTTFGKFVFEEYFQTDSHTRPFYVLDRHHGSISRLLAGEEIDFKANILESPYDKNAIKFKEIKINFNSRNKTIIDDLKTKLLNFDVIMKHMGNSQYRCNNNIYSLSSDSQVFKFSFNEQNGESIRRYTDVHYGRYVLSPYARWTIRLIDANETSFSQLAAFAGLVDLELIGQGRYISKNNNVCGVHLNDYYFKDEDISITDIIDF